MCCLSAKLMQRAFAVNTSMQDKEQEPEMTSLALNFTLIKALKYIFVLSCHSVFGAALCKLVLTMVSCLYEQVLWI